MTQEQLIPISIAIAVGASVLGGEWLWKWLFRSKRRQRKAFAAAVRTVRKYFQTASDIGEDEYAQLTMEQLEKIVWDHEHGWKVTGNRVTGDARAETR